MVPFNTEFVPFLEFYFQYNAYPSSNHRAVMATMGMMEPRQIEIWFQNYRRRAINAGRIVRRLGPADPVPLEWCIDRFAASIPRQPDTRDKPAVTTQEI
ncbi:hypothetical protein K438DRAFT_1799952 [Mycena galopus ATCC 62051]|nr:hypothetical protein K438DRAFT_1799952 [Mycena galopus ATCC 62051]